MTERVIRDMLAFADAERAAAIALAGELYEIAGLAHAAGVTVVEHRLRAEARRAAAKVELIDRLIGTRPGDSEDTAPIVEPADKCPRCSGTGEVPVCRS